MEAKDHKETIIRLDHDDKIAEVWTENRAVISMLKRVGATPLDRQIQGQWWTVGVRVGSKGFLCGKRRARALSDAQRANLEAARAARRARMP